MRAGVSRALSTAAAVLFLGASSCSAAPPTTTRSAKSGVATPAKPAPRAAAVPGSPPDSAAVLALLSGVTNATCPLPGVASGGQVSNDHVKRLAGAGFRTVLDMRGEDEPRGYDEATAVRAAGLDYVLIPITGALDDATFDRVRAFMSDARHHPVMVHCASGNRVGVALLPWLVLDRGWTLERAVAVAEEGGMRVGALRERAMDYIARKRRQG